jgi:hypothetical protein
MEFCQEQVTINDGVDVLDVVVGEPEQWEVRFTHKSGMFQVPAATVVVVVNVIVLVLCCVVLWCCGVVVLPGKTFCPSRRCAHKPAL